MIWPLSPAAAVVVDIVLWAVLGVVVGWSNHRRSLDDLLSDGWLPALRRWEVGGRSYQTRLRIRSWKDRLPDAGAVFADGVSKRRLPGRDRAGLEWFAAETRRAERVHWTLLGAGAFFWAWNPPGLAIFMMLYAVVANVPFILVQRFNRARVLHILARPSRDAPSRPGLV